MNDTTQPRDAIGRFGTVPGAGLDGELLDTPASVNAVTRQTDAPIQRLTLDSTTRRIDEWVRMVDQGEIEMTPPYQRGDVWTDDQRVALIESFMRGVPVPSITVNDRWKAIRDINGPLYAVIDGKQRLTTALMWHRGDLPVPASWFEPGDVEVTEETDDGPYVRRTGLTPRGRRLFDNRALISVSEAQVVTVEEEAHIYLLLNKGGTSHTEDDLARAEGVAGRRERAREAIARRINPRAWESYDRIATEGEEDSEMARLVVQHTLDEADGILDSIPQD